jgi:Sulfotransferase domain
MSSPPGAPASGRRPATVEELRQVIRRASLRQFLDPVRAFRPRATDVFIVTFPKCGTTWMQQIVHGLRTRGSMDFEEISEVVPYMDITPRRGLDLDAPQVAEPRAFKTHRPWEDIPRGGRYIYVLREAGDALVSLYHFINGAIFETDAIDIDVYAREFYIPGNLVWGMSYWQQVRSWWPRRHDAGVLFCCYEDMQRDLPGTVRRVARFMGLDADEDLLALTTQQASFDFMRRHVTQFDDHPIQREMERAQGLSPGKPFEKVRTGRIGDRGRELSPDTRALLDETWAREIAEPLGIRSCEELRAETTALVVS